MPAMPRRTPLRFAVLACATVVCSCFGGSGKQQEAPITIVTATLPNGQVGHAYSATLSANGGTAPLTWSLTAGALPAGLTLAPNGLISGTPTTAAAAVPLTFTVSSAAGGQTENTRLTLNVSPANISVSVSPARAGIVVTQTALFTATTNDYGGVKWNISPAGGSFSAASSKSGTAVTLTAPSTAGVYTITATSVTDTAQQAAVTVGVTDLAGVYTYHNDLGRDGANMQEYALTPANVNTTAFGKLFSCTVDGAVWAQPLWVANLSIAGRRHNVVFVATAHDSLYAFDADANPCTQLWQVSLIDASHGGTSGEISIHRVDGDFGVTGTPVIDPQSDTLYLVTKSQSPGTAPTYYERLHAIDITNGEERSGAPVSIAASYPGTGAGGASVTFNSSQELQRPGLALLNGTVYVAWGAFNEPTPPWYGWIIGYAGTSLAQSSVFNVAPNRLGASIWMSGGAPAADADGNLYVISGNGAFDVTNTSGPNNDYGDCFLQLNSTLQVSSWFAPSDEATDDAKDVDFGSGGAALVIDLSSGPLRRLVVGGGKDAMLYVLDGDSMGGLGDPNAWQHFSVGQGIFATAAFWNNTLFLAPVASPLLAYAFDSSTNMFNTTPTSRSATPYGFPGATASVSASGSHTDGVVWALDTTNYCTLQSPGCGAAVLHAYGATNLANELWNSSMVSTDAAGNAVKFTVPTVANGKVYVGSRGNNTGGVYGSTAISGELDVYGLKPE
jgi:hypothetical protein